MEKENKNKRLEIRLNEKDFEILSFVASVVGMNVSKYLRMLIDSSIAPIKFNLQNGKMKWEEVKKIEN